MGVREIRVSSHGHRARHRRGAWLRLAIAIRRLVMWPAVAWYRWRWRRWASSRRVIAPTHFVGQEVWVGTGADATEAVIVGRANGGLYRVRDAAGYETIVRAEEIST